MKKTLLLITLVLGLAYNSKAQVGEFYTATAGEMIFSFANIDDGNINADNIIRWSPVFNIQFTGNYNFSQNFGGFVGLAIRNVGYIERFYDEGIQKEVRVKYRNYNLGIPLGVKIGNMDKFFVYGGYELEFPFHTKRKIFIDDSKTKKSEWFSSQVPTIYNTVFFGLQFPMGFNVKFKYYLTGWFNQDYIEDGVKIYDWKNVNVFYFSIFFNLFKGKEAFYTEYK